VFSPDDRHLLTAGTDGIARIWDIATGRTVLPPMVHGAALRGARFSPDGAMLVTFGQNTRLRRWNAATGEPVGAPMESSGWLNHVEFSPDGRWLASAGRNARVSLWEAATGRYVGEPIKHQNSVAMVVFSPDSCWLASASSDATVQVTRIDRPSSVPVLITHAYGVNGISFSPDGRWLLTLSGEGAARVWDPSTGLPVTEPLQRVTTPEARAFFAGNGDSVMVLGADQNVDVWSVPRYQAAIAAPLVTAAELVGRMKMEEANRFVVSPTTDWDKLAGPMDLTGVLYPETRNP